MLSLPEATELNATGRQVLLVVLYALGGYHIKYPVLAFTFLYSDCVHLVVVLTDLSLPLELNT